MRTSNLLVGEAGRLRVASELLRRGHRVLLPCIDDGVDLYTEDGIGIQVKSSSLGGNYYTFLFRSWKMIRGRKTQKYPHLDKRVDCVVLWGLDDDILWVLPASVVRGMATVRVPSPNRKLVRYTTRPTKYRQYVSAWNLIAKG